jgi:hypothetical protein
MRTAQYFPLVLAAALSFGCGASGIQIQAQAATALRTVNNDAVELIETTCEEKSRQRTTRTSRPTRPRSTRRPFSRPVMRSRTHSTQSQPPTTPGRWRCSQPSRRMNTTCRL